MTEPELDIKTRILLAAKKLFAQQGYDGTSVRQICDEAGANVSLVSYHFGGKEKVFEALFEHFFPGHMMNALAEESMSSPVEGIRRIIGEVVKFTMTDREMSDIVQLEITLRTHRTATVFRFWTPSGPESGNCCKRVRIRDCSRSSPCLMRCFRLWVWLWRTNGPRIHDLALIISI